MTSPDDDISALLSQPSETSDEVSPHLDETSFLLPATVPVKTSEPLSPEETAWADSCLDLDSIFSDDKWSSFRDALLNAIDSFPTPNDDNSMRIDDALEERKETEAEMDEQKKEAVPADNVDEQNAEVGRPYFRAIVNDEVGDADRDGAKEGPSDDQEDTDAGRDSIFKVWDLQTAYLDDGDGDTDLVKQLNKLLRGDDEEDLPASHDEARVVPVPENLNELVADMGDLSLDNVDN